MPAMGCAIGIGDRRRPAERTAADADRASDGPGSGRPTQVQPDRRRGPRLDGRPSATPSTSSGSRPSLATSIRRPPGRMRGWGTCAPCGEPVAHRPPLAAAQRVHLHLDAPVAGMAPRHDVDAAQELPVRDHDGRGAARRARRGRRPRRARGVATASTTAAGRVAPRRRPCSPRRCPSARRASTSHGSSSVRARRGRVARRREAERAREVGGASGSNATRAPGCAAHRGARGRRRRPRTVDVGRSADAGLAPRLALARSIIARGHARRGHHAAVARVGRVACRAPRVAGRARRRRPGGAGRCTASRGGRSRRRSSRRRRARRRASSPARPLVHVAA